MHDLDEIILAIVTRLDIESSGKVEVNLVARLSLNVPNASNAIWIFVIGALGCRDVSAFAVKNSTAASLSSSRFKTETMPGSFQVGFDPNAIAHGTNSLAGCLQILIINVT